MGAALCFLSSRRPEGIDGLILEPVNPHHLTRQSAPVKRDTTGRMLPPYCLPSINRRQLRGQPWGLSTADGSQAAARQAAGVVFDRSTESSTQLTCPLFNPLSTYPRPTCDSAPCASRL